MTKATAMALAIDARELDFELGWWKRPSANSAMRFGIARGLDAGQVKGAINTAGFVASVLR